MKRSWLITGVSSGFGLEMTKQLLAKGDTVIGTVRKPEAVADLVKAYPDTFDCRLLDVRDTDAVRRVSMKPLPNTAASTSSFPMPVTACSVPPRN